MASKHQAIFDWVASCPLLTDTLLFDFLEENHGSCGLSPTATDKYLPGKQYVDGTGIKEYVFELQAMFTVSDSTDSTNIDNMNLMDTWRDWVEAQQAAGNFPDFGPECSGYRVRCPDNMPTQAMRYENNFAKYQFPAVVQYYDATTY